MKTPAALLAALVLAGCSSDDNAVSDGGSDATTDAVPSDAADATSADASHDAPSSADASDGATDADGAAPDAGPAVPAPAASAGFTHLVFEDDFTTTTTIAPTKDAASGYKWYWSFDITSAPTPWTVHPTDTAAAYGDAGAGGNASPAGGILTVSGPGQPNDALVTVPGWALSTGNDTLPALGDGNWAHAYFEAYIQTRLDGNASTDPKTGWPAFWSWSVQGLKNFGFGGSSLTTANPSEIDFFETYGTIFGQTPGNWTATMHQWPANASSDGKNQHMDNGWHTYGCSWTMTGANAGKVQFFYDGAQVDDTIMTGAGQTQFSLEGLSQFVILGTGQGWDMNVDWVRVWQ